MDLLARFSVNPCDFERLDGEPERPVLRVSRRRGRCVITG